MMFGIRREVASWKIIKTCWKTFQRNKNVIAGVNVACFDFNSGNAAAVHPAIFSTDLADRKAGGFVPADGGSSFGLKANVAGNGIIARRFTMSSHVYRKRVYDSEDEHAIDRHSNNPLNKYLGQSDESSEISLEEIARKQKRKIQSMTRARAAREFSQGPEKRSLSWDTIQQIYYLRQENPEEWSVATLAESFNVSEEVIAKVLKSKFRPNAKTRRKQDLAAAESTGYVTGGASQTQAIVATGNADRPNDNEGKGNKRRYKSTQASGFVKESQSKAGHDKSAVVKNRPLSRESQEHQMMTSRKDHWDAQKEEIDEAQKDPEMEFSIGDIDFENVDSLMGQAKLKPQVFQKGRNFYNERGEFLYRI